jgi:hypothetical protein
MVRKKAISKSFPGVIQPPYRNLILGFSALAIILVLIILYFALAQATIVITPLYQQQKVGFAIQIVDKNSNPINNLASGRILGEIKETTQETIQELPATSYQTTNTKAGGEITIINNYQKNQPLIATTRFLTNDSKLYRLINGVTVPAGGKITAQVLADKEGEQYEIGPTKLIIPGLWEGLRDKIYGETQGLKRQTSTKFLVTQKNIDEATANLKKQLISQAKEKLSENLSENQQLSDNDLISEIIKYSVSARPETAAEKFTITMSLGIKAVVFDKNALKENVFANLPDIYKQEGTMVKVDPKSLNYEITLLDENSENLIAQVKGDYNISVSTLKIDKSALKGRGKTDAEKYLMSLGNIEKVKIRLPFWTKYLPTLVDNIDLQIKQ